MITQTTTTPVAPDQGLPTEFLSAVAERLPAGYRASVDYPGMLRFTALGRDWLTGLTGLHVSDAGGDGGFPGDEALVALERVGILHISQYVATLNHVIDAATPRYDVRHPDIVVERLDCTVDRSTGRVTDVAAYGCGIDGETRAWTLLHLTPDTAITFTTTEEA